MSIQMRPTSLLRINEEALSLVTINEETLKELDLDRLSIMTFPQPAYPRFASFEQRLWSFLYWPPAHPIEPYDLAEAGLFYQEFGDKVTCYQCAGSLGFWKLGDKPIFEHARWFPQCAYVRLTKGNDYVMQSRGSKWKACHCKPPQPWFCKESCQRFEHPMRKAGYPPPFPYRSWDDAERHMYSPIEESASDDQLPALGASNVEITINVPSSSIEPPRPLPEETFEDLRERLRQWGQKSVAITAEQRQTEQVVGSVEVADLENSSSSSSSSRGASSLCENSRASKSSPKKLLRRQQKRKSIRKEEDEEDVKPALLDGNEIDQMVPKCKICFEKDMTIAFLPCGHLFTCGKCVLTLSSVSDLRCPLCRQNVLATVKIFVT